MRNCKKLNLLQRFMLCAREETCSNCEHNQTFNRYLTQFARETSHGKQHLTQILMLWIFWVKIIPAIILLNSGMHERMFEKGNRKMHEKIVHLFFWGIRKESSKLPVLIYWRSLARRFLCKKWCFWWLNEDLNFLCVSTYNVILGQQKT